MEIRPARSNDAAAIARIQVRGWRAAYAGLMPQDYLDSLSVPDRTARWRAWIDAPSEGVRIWMAEEDGGAVGFASTGPSRDPDAEPGTGEVHAIYLEPSLIGTGRGRALFAHVVDDLRAQGYRRAELWVLPGNNRARRFYEAAGWRTDGSQKNEPFDDIEVVEVRYRVDL
jgi:GNAT superfamily N-acetyltransferase